MCTMGVSSSSCRSLEAVAQMSGQNIAVLAMHRDTKPSTTWSIFCMPCCLKTLPIMSNSTSTTSNIHSNSILVIPALSMPSECAH